MSTDLQQNLQKLLRQANAGDEDLAMLKGYGLTRKLGQGGMGAVFLLHDPSGMDSVAIKLVRPELTENEDARRLFHREITNGMALQHSNIVRFLDFGSYENLLFLLMDFCPGGSVAERIHRAGGKLPLREALDITFQALDGLAYAHQVRLQNVELADGSVADGIGLVHRDLKPHNLFLTNSGDGEIVKIGDFGLAKAFQLAGLSGYTQTGHTCGTPEFMSRQQAVDYKYSGPEVDVWSVAACLYNMLTGHFPRDFSGGDRWHTVFSTDPIPISKRDPSVPPALAVVIDKALDDTNEDLSCSSASALYSALKRALA